MNGNVSTTSLIFSTSNRKNVSIPTCPIVDFETWKTIFEFPNPPLHQPGHTNHASTLHEIPAMGWNHCGFDPVRQNIFEVLQTKN
jgi:hypothetical protein